MNRIIGLLAAAVLLASISLGDATGRGFGGFRGGFGGGFRAGGFASGGWGGGAVHERSSFGSFGGGGWAGARDSGFERSGYENRGNWREYNPEVHRDYSRENWRPHEEYDAGRVRDNSGASRTQLDKFLGMPTDVGLGHLGMAGAGAVDASRVTASSIKGPFGGSAAFVSGTHIDYIPPARLSAQGWSVRNTFNNYNLFTPTWYNAHTRAWIAGDLAASAWTPASWFDIAGWMGCDTMPEDYNYGQTVLYSDDTVYMEGRPVGTYAEYYDQADSLASSGEAKSDDKTQWMPLGVFALVQTNQTDATTIFQLSVNKQGIIRGNCYDKLTDTTLPLRGAVDKKTQRVAWIVGDNKKTVFDTGLYNLTKDEAPTLVHFGKDRTQNWLLVRLTNQTEANNS
jgi:hypothetical protein